MAKKTKKNIVVKKAVKAAKPAKKNKPVQAKAKAKPAKPAPKKSSKPVAKKKAAKPVKPSKVTSTKKIPAKGNAGKSVKPQVKKQITTKAQAKAVKKAAPAKPVKPAKATKPAKPVKAAVKTAPAAQKKVAKPAEAAPKAAKETTPKKAAAPVSKTVEKPKAVKAAPPKEEKKKPEPPKKEKKSKAKKGEGEEEEEIILEDIPPVDPELLNIPKPANGRKGKGKKAPAGPRVIVEPIAPPKPQVMPADKKKEPKGKFEMEYVVHASAYLLFEFITTPSGLSEWFADDVNIRQGIYTFFWDGSEQQAKLIGYKDGKMARFQWLDKNDGSYFEFRLEIDELTGDVSLIITDFAEDPAEMATTKLLWDSQVNKLLHVIGAYY